MPIFKLMFRARTIAETRKLIIELSNRHMSAYDNEDRKALEAGRAIREGAFTKVNLKVIYDWKQKSVSKRFSREFELFKNISNGDASDALRIAVNARAERSAVAVLVGLGGVGVAVASAILAMIYPEKYTIIDRLALRALNVNSYTMSIDLYLDYLGFCREFSKEHGVTLRELDHALWGLGSKKRRKNT